MEEKILKNENFKSCYINWVKCETSLYDISLLFGQVQESNEKEILINTSTNIKMSPQHAKALLEVLKGAIDGYEANFGKINMGPMNK